MDFDLMDVKNLVATFDRGPTGDPFADARYQVQIDETGNPRYYYRMFYHLCKKFQPSMAVELGAYQASCAAHMAAGGAGTVVTIDHFSDRIGEYRGDDYNERLAREAAQAYMNLSVVKGWTTDEAVIAEALETRKPVDLLFIDAWHHIDYARADWAAWEPHLADTALVVCDDLCNAPPTLWMMEEWWKEVSEGYESFVTDPLIATCPMGFFKYVRGQTLP